MKDLEIWKIQEVDLDLWAIREYTAKTPCKTYKLNKQEF